MASNPNARTASGDQTEVNRVHRRTRSPEHGATHGIRLLAVLIVGLVFGSSSVAHAAPVQTTKAGAVAVAVARESAAPTAAHSIVPPTRVSPKPTVAYSSSWIARTIWLNRSETYSLKVGASYGAVLFWWPPVAVTSALLAIFAGDAYDRGGCIKLIQPRGTSVYYPQQYWGGYCR